MSLATRCPACGTVFRVVQDQLRVSQGWVRCGRCSEAFNALESMVELRPALPATAAEVGPAAPAVPGARTEAAPAPTPPDAPFYADSTAEAPAQAVELPTPAETVAPAASPGATARAPEAPAAESTLERTGDTSLEAAGQAAAPAFDERREPVFGFDEATAAVVDPGESAPEAPGISPAAATVTTRSQAEPYVDAVQDAGVVAPDLDAPALAEPGNTDAEPDAARAETAATMEPAPATTVQGTDAPAPASTIVDLDVDLNDTLPTGASVTAEDPEAPPGPAPRPQHAAATTHDAGALDAGQSAAEPDDAPLSTLQAPSFIRKADRAERWRRPGVRRALMACAALAVLVLVAQVVHAFKDRIAAGSPALRPVLQQACATLGCRVGEYRQIDALSVESSGLVKVEGAPVYRLSVTLRNRASIDVAAPALDLSLTDAQGKLIARRVLQMSDLNLPLRSLKAGSELPIQVPLGISDRQVSGYTVEIFYP